MGSITKRGAWLTMPRRIKGAPGTNAKPKPTASAESILEKIRR